MSPVHRIKRQVIELEVEENQLNPIERKAMARRVVQLLEEVIDELYPHETNDQYYKIPRLELDLGAIESSEFLAYEPLVLKNKITSVVTKQLLPVLTASKQTQEESISVENDSTESKGEETARNSNSLNHRTAEAFIHFLQNGQFPWWGRKEGREILAIEQPIPFQQLQAIVKEKPAILPRLLHHYSDHQLLHWSDSTLTSEAQDLLGFLLHKTSRIDNNSAWRTVIWEITYLKQYDYNNTKLLLETIVKSLWEDRADYRDSLYQTLQKDRSVPAVAWLNILKKYQPHSSKTKSSQYWKNLSYEEIRDQITKDKKLIDALGRQLSPEAILEKLREGLSTETGDAIAYLLQKGNSPTIQEIVWSCAFEYQAEELLDRIVQKIEINHTNLITQLSQSKDSKAKHWLKHLSKTLPKQRKGISEIVWRNLSYQEIKKHIEEDPQQVVLLQRALTTSERLHNLQDVFSTEIIDSIAYLLKQWKHLEAEETSIWEVIFTQETDHTQSKQVLVDIVERIRETAYSSRLSSQLNEENNAHSKQWRDLLNSTQTARKTDAIEDQSKGQLHLLLTKLGEEFKKQELNTRRLKESVAHFREMSRWSEYPEIAALAKDLLPIFKHRLAHFQRQEKGLLDSHIQELKILLNAVNDQFTHGNIPHIYQSDWKALQRGLETIYVIDTQKNEMISPFPDSGKYLTLWKQWQEQLTSNRESKIALDQLQQFLNRYKYLNPEAAWQQLKQEGDWVIREAKRQLKKGPKEESKKKVETSITSLEERMYLSNAGLVILWSFMARMFDNLGWLEDNDFKDEEKQERAILLLHYLGTGQTEAIESELLMNKLLLGWPLAEPCAVSIILSAEEKESVSDLLGAVLGYNPMLKTSSTEAFRGNFLIREGVLSQWPEGWQLHIESKPYDLLLKQFPWSWNTVKTPWMEKPMMVEWK